MTVGDPPAEFRAGVMRRLAPRRSFQSWSTWTMVRWSVVGAAVALAIVVWSRDGRRTANPPQVARTVAGTEAPPTESIANIPVTPAVSSSTARARRPAAPVPQPGLPLLETPETLVVGWIQPQPLSITQLSVVPLATEPIRVGPPDGGGSYR